MIWFILFLLIAPLFVLFLVLFFLENSVRIKYKKALKDTESLAESRKFYQQEAERAQDQTAKELRENQDAWVYLSQITPQLFKLLRTQAWTGYMHEWRWDKEKIKRLATDVKTRADDDITLALIRESGL